MQSIHSSKLPGYGVLVRDTPGFEFYVVHVVRDPRAVAYSWMRTKLQERDFYMQRRGARRAPADGWHSMS